MKRRLLLAGGLAAAGASLLATFILLRNEPDGEQPIAVAVERGPIAPLAATGHPSEQDRICLKKVISDWYEDGQVDRRYRRGCYAAALGVLPTAPRDYSSVYDDLRRAYERAASSAVLDEEEGTFRTVGFGSPEEEVRAVLGSGSTEGGFAPTGRLPAEVAVPLALPNPPGAEHERPRLLRYPDEAFLLVQDRVYAILITAPEARTAKGVRIGDDLSVVGRRYDERSCDRATGGEQLGGGLATYPVCRVRIGPHRYLSFGGDPIRSFTLFSRASLASSAPTWLQRNAQAELTARFGAVRPRAVRYSLGERARAIFEFDRAVICKGCSTSLGGQPRGRTATFQFDRATHTLIEFSLRTGGAPAAVEISHWYDMRHLPYPEGVQYRVSLRRLLGQTPYPLSWMRFSTDASYRGAGFRRSARLGTVHLSPGSYVVSGAARTCAEPTGGCSVLGKPQDRCTRRVKVEAGRPLRIVVGARSGEPCAINVAAGRR